MEEEHKQAIINALAKHGANLPCPRCGNLEFSLFDGYFYQTIQDDLKVARFGGPSIPSVIVYCKRCGFMIQHSLGVLELLPSEGTSK